MPVVLIGVAVVIVVGVIIVALGRGGELAQSTADFAPFEIDDVTATDVALLRPPPSLCGYNMPATDQALSRIAQTMTERDVEIATLRRQVAELRSMIDATAAGGRTVLGEPASPGGATAPGSGTVPGVTAPAGGTLPGEAAAPGDAMFPGTAAVPGSTTAPGGAAAPGAPSSRVLPGQSPPPVSGPRARQRVPLPVRPSAWRRERAEPPAAPDLWPPQVPWSAWERSADPATGEEAAAAPGPLAGDDADPGAASQSAEPDPVAETDPAAPGEAW